MAPPRVIEDSDDDTEEAISLEQSPEKVDLIETGAPAPSPEPHIQTLQSGTDSTDYGLFQTLYHANMAGSQVQHDADSPKLPQLADNIINQRMSTTPPSTKKSSLKRTKTMNTSSLTSVGEPTASHRKMKRAKSMKDIDLLTQVSTPQKTKSSDLTQATISSQSDNGHCNDIWDFPSSSAADQNPNTRPNTATKIKSTEIQAPVKGIGGLKRSKTMAPVSSGPIYKQTSKRSKDDNDSLTKRYNRAVSGKVDEDFEPALPKLKRRKRETSVNLAVEEHSYEGAETPSRNGLELWKTTVKSASISKNVLSSIGAENHLVSNSTDILPDAINIQSSPRVDANLRNASSVIMETPSIVETSSIANEIPSVVNGTVLNGTSPITTSSKHLLSSKISSSALAVPSSLTDSQKLIYEMVDIKSNTEALPRLLDIAGAPNRYHDVSSTIPDEPLSEVSKTPVLYPELSSTIPDEPPSQISKTPIIYPDESSTIPDEPPSEVSKLPIILPSSPPKPAVKRKSGRPKSKNTEVVDLPRASSVVTEVPKPAKRLKRSKTLDERKLPGREETLVETIGIEEKVAKIASTPVPPTVAYDEKELVKTPSKCDDVPNLNQTPPTKDVKKGPDQHSPLQSGRVPYRVGLSKKTRIAPLLRIIRK